MARLRSDDRGVVLRALLAAICSLRQAGQQLSALSDADGPSCGAPACRRSRGAGVLPFRKTRAEIRLRCVIPAQLRTNSVKVVVCTITGFFPQGPASATQSSSDGADGRFGQDMCLPASPANGKGPPNCDVHGCDPLCPLCA